MKIYDAYLELEQKQVDFLNELLKMNGAAIYDKHGLKRDENIGYTVQFGNWMECDINLVVCDEDETPYVDTVLFNNGREVCCATMEDESFTDGNDPIVTFEYDGDEYRVFLKIV